MKKPKGLTVLSYGGGQDSCAIRDLIVFDPTFRKQYVGDHDLLVVMADTGNEHPETYEHVEDTKDFCAQHGIEFVHITADMGYHGDSWRTLTTQYREKKSCGSVSGSKACTGNLKINPIYKFLEAHIEERYGFKAGRKQGIKAFAEAHGRIRVILGIAAGEETRAIKNFRDEAEWRRDQRIAAAQKRAKAHCKTHKVKAKFRYRPTVLAKWMALNVDRVYPLIDRGIDRAGAQAVIKSYGNKVPLPSNCMLCPFLSKQEMLWLHRFYPESFKEWVGYEKAKIEEYRKRGLPDSQNHGVKGRKRLTEFLSEAIAEYGHWSNERLDEFKRSHGHCVATSY